MLNPFRVVEVPTQRSPTTDLGPGPHTQRSPTVEGGDECGSYFVGSIKRCLHRTN